MDSAESKALRDLTRAINKATVAIQETTKAMQQATKINIALIETTEIWNLMQQEKFESYQKGQENE